MAFIEVKNVVKQYANHRALDDVSLKIEKGRVFGLLGPNGAGKTSLIRIINQITAPDSGQVLIEGRPISREDVARIGYLPEERGLYPKMKVGEQAVYLAQLKGLKKDVAKERLKAWFEKFEIMPWWDKKVEELSKGMQQKVQFICTVLHEPDFFIFDEPFSGFDPVNAELLKKEILELKNQGRTIIFSTHNMQSVEEICDDIALINKSHLVLSGTVADIRREHATSLIKISVPEEPSAEMLSDLAPIETAWEHGVFTLTLEKEEGESNQDFIARLPRELELLSFNQLIPSMHDIFIKTVKDNG